MGAPITASGSFPSHRTQPLSRTRNPKHIGCLYVDTPAEGRTVPTCLERSSRRSSRGNTDMHLNDESPTAHVDLYHLGSMRLGTRAVGRTSRHLPSVQKRSRCRCPAV